MRYSLTDLRVFVAVADAGNVSRGAAACFLSPSSASLRIKQLEETLGVQLFVRQPRGMTLTRPGQLMLEHCRRCLAELEQMHANLAPYACGVKGSITLFANSTAIASHLPGALSQFLRGRPSVRVTMEEKLSFEIVSAVAEGRADIGVVTWDDEHPQLEFRLYQQDELIVVAPRTLKLGARGSVKFADCLSQPFVSLQGGAAIHAFIFNKALSLGHHLDVRIQVASFSAVVALVAGGVGIAVVPRSVAEHSSRTGVQLLSLQETWAKRVLRVCWRRDPMTLSEHAVALVLQLCGEDALNRPG